jgi:diguanylate cyclase (GGDEF)-like protein/PAS domain S-box-containing protein
MQAVLVIEDNPGDARLLREMLREQGAGTPRLVHFERMSDAETYLSENEADVILLDLGLPDAQGLSAVRRAQAAAPRTPLVVLTGLDDESMAAQALQVGAEDYLIKGEIEGRGLMRSLRYAIERKSMEAALFAEKERAEVTLNCMGDAVACADASGNITYLNPVAEIMTGWPSSEAIGRQMAEIVRIVDLPGLTPFPGLTNGEIVRNGTVQLPSTCVLMRRDGLEIPVDACLAPIRDRARQAIGTVVVLRDATMTRALMREITHLAEHDFLTGLPNRILLNDRIGQAITLARRNDFKLAVLFLDLDGFKNINDSLGHAIGDRLLKSVTERLVSCVRASDTVSRQGGDEFIVLLSDVAQPEGAVITSKRLLEAVAQAHAIEPHDLHVTASIGVSIYPDDASDAESLIKNADTAMYQAKENGRQSVRFFTPAMNVSAVERLSIEGALRRALERQEFELHYQPKIDLATGAIAGAEALLRWTQPSRGNIPPVEFIPIAEESGLIVSIGAWVLREACRQAKAWTEAGLPIKTIAVNVSAVEFREDSFLDGVFRVLAETGLDPRALELELTESVLMKYPESTAPILQTLRESGVRVTIDDFGTGYSSLSYLRKFPVDTLKIDQSFVRQIDGSGGDTHIVGAVIAMARNLKLKVVAEGVETAEELAFLRAHDCDEAQGYYFSRPVPAAGFAAILERVPQQEPAAFIP